MKFKSPLIEAVLLKRYFRFLAEVALSNRKKRMLYCPNLNPLPHCDVLGSRIWFSMANRLSQGYLDIWELTEVNGGWLVSINPEHAKALVREALECEKIPTLENFRFLYSPTISKLGNGIELLARETGEQCFMSVQSIWFADERNHGLFPQEPGIGISVLYDLMALRDSGHRTLLFYCAQHTGITCICPINHVDPQYGKVLREAINKGVEVLAYRVNINVQEMTLESQIPILLPEDVILR
jgi:sugar fermentation stimulation protein A